MKRTLGGDRIGSGNKMKVEMHGFERSTHDKGYLWRSTMSAGTLVPFMCEVGLPGDTWDIDLNAFINTHPTVGPLFGSEKVELHIFTADIRLYQGQLHNNKLKIGFSMSSVKLPQMILIATEIPLDHPDPDNAQINPSCILNYLGIRGVGQKAAGAANGNRSFNAVPLLAVWDIYKNYFANKQEELGAVIHADLQAIIAVDNIYIDPGTGNIIVTQGGTGDNIQLATNYIIQIDYPAAQPLPSQIMLNRDGEMVSLSEIGASFINTVGSSDFYKYTNINNVFIMGWDMISPNQIIPGQPKVVTFDLDNIDEMRERIMAATQQSGAYDINTAPSLQPYNLLLDWVNGQNPQLSTQEGLPVKTYNSDLFNNWLRTEYIDGPNGINAVTAIDTSSGEFEINALMINKKVYDMMMRIAVSGGTYDDWLDVNWTEERMTRIETPVYHGGLIKELVFQEVISNSESSDQPLGTLGGKGTLSQKHKGGKVKIKVSEPTYIIGLVSITPRIDNSQGNSWDSHLLTLDDLHKPIMDQIGFQELIEEQMAYWTTKKSAGGVWQTKSAGKQPAWINYMTSVNKTYGNFAIKDNEMFMTLNRRYEYDRTTGEDIIDLTTYIDPVKFNHIFAQTALDAQNYWTQISVDATARRKMSAKVMPTL